MSRSRKSWFGAARADERPTARRRLMPHMVEYEAKFADDGDVRWLPYLMYFHPRGHRSAVVNTDQHGFRFSHHGTGRCSAGELGGADRVRVLAGSSTVFGIGATNDAATLSSRMSAHDERGSAWVNFGGRSFNSTQELMLFSLNLHLLPEVEEIVLLSGFNNLGLARQPAEVRGDHGAFFMGNQFFDALGTRQAPGEPAALEDQLRYAADLTGRHLTVWKALADRLGARLTYVLQPLASWVRDDPCPEEAEIFAELDAVGGFSEAYGDILGADAQSGYAKLVQTRADRLGVRFIDLTPLLAQWATPRDWVFVDRIHFTDFGNDLVARNLSTALNTDV